MVKDSGQREQFATGSVRDTRKGKGRFDLIPPLAMMRIAKHFEAGADKYGDRNWEKGQPLSRFYDSGRRHLERYWAGEADEDHLAAAVWNFMAMMHFEELHDNDYTVPGGVMDRPWDRKEDDGLAGEAHEVAGGNRTDVVGSGDSGDDGC